MEEINNLSKANQIRQLEALGLKEKERKNHNAPEIRSGQILENGIVGMRSEIPKEETQKQIWGRSENN